MSSHHTSPSGVSTTLVKIVFRAIVVHRVGVGFLRGARRHAEETRFRVHRVKAAIFADANPGNIVAEAGHFPTRQHGLHHRQVGFAASAGECGGHVIFFSFRRSQAEDEHVFRQPAFLLRDDRCDAEREAFLAQQRVAAVTRTVGPDRRFIGEMNDVFVLRVGLAWP